MSASWNGRVRLDEADALPGHYYVSIRDERGRTALAFGPFTQTRPGKDGHAQALGAVRTVRRYLMDSDWRNAPWYAYGTCRLPLQANPPAGRLNDQIGA